MTKFKHPHILGFYSVDSASHLEYLEKSIVRRVKGSDGYLELKLDYFKNLISLKASSLLSIGVYHYLLLGKLYKCKVVSVTFTLKNPVEDSFVVLRFKGREHKIKIKYLLNLSRN